MLFLLGPQEILLKLWPLLWLNDYRRLLSIFKRTREDIQRRLVNQNAQSWELQEALAKIEKFIRFLSRII